MTKHQLMRKIKEADFAMQETVLFLDTHPNCKRALHYFEEIKEKSRRLTVEYESKYGPITHSGANYLSSDAAASYAKSESGWKWVSSPWPWQEGFCGCDENEGGNR